MSKIRPLATVTQTATQNNLVTNKDRRGENFMIALMIH